MVGCDVASECVIGQQQAMAKDLWCEIEHVLRRGIGPASEHRNGTGPLDQVDRCTWAGAEADHRAQIGEVEPIRVARALHEVDRVLGDRTIDEDFIGALLQPDELIERNDLRRHRCGRGDGHPVEDHHLLVGGGVIEDDLHHEPVTLRVGELVNAFRFDRILCGDDEERRLDRVRDSADGDLLFGHDFE